VSQSPRKAIVLFLLYQMTLSNPDLASNSIGVKSPFTDYFCSLPKDVPLPTFLSAEERDLLVGTSLSDAVEQKLSSLEKEFDVLRERTMSIGWCSKVWWDEETGQLTFNDWLLSDALYRSRALELPQDLGHAMVPLVDMANHAADSRYNARFEIGEDGKVLLLVREGKHIHEKEEICITYGAGGASEMIFSYGFLEEGVQSAREMFLTLRAPEDDPLRIAKMHFAKEAPGVRLFTDAQGQPSWESAFVWWACINEEDGLDFEVLQTVDGGRELQALWQGRELEPDNLQSVLMDDPRRDIFKLRATVIIQERVAKQGEELSISQAAFEENLSRTPEISEFTSETIRRLHQLELGFLMSSYGTLESEVRSCGSLVQFLSCKVAELISIATETRIVGLSDCRRVPCREFRCPWVRRTPGRGFLVDSTESHPIHTLSVFHLSQRGALATQLSLESTISSRTACTVFPAIRTAWNVGETLSSSTIRYAFYWLAGQCGIVQDPSWRVIKPPRIA